MKFEIVNLANAPQFIEQVAKCLYDEWDENDGRTLQDAIYRTRHSIFTDRIPQTLIAKSGDQLVGTVHIWQNDLKCRQDLSPWMAALYVKKEYRGQGIGTALQKACIETVKKLGYKSLYLITDHIGLYEKMGWEFMELAPIMGEKKTRVYQYKITGEK